MLALVVATAEAVATTATDRVNFINEDQAGRVLARLLKHVAHAAGAHADEHLHKVRSADGEEGRVGFARDGFGQQRLAGAGRADHENALGDAPAELLKFLRVLEEFHQLRNLFLRFFDTRHILEGRLVLFLRKHPGLALAEAERAFARHLDLADEEKPDEHADEEDGAEAVDQSEQDRVRLARLEDFCVHQLVFHLVRQAHARGEGPRLLVASLLLVFALHFMNPHGLWIVNDDALRDLIGFNQLHELHLGQAVHLRGAAVLEHHQQRYRAEDGNPQNVSARRNLELAVLPSLVGVFIIFSHEKCSSRAQSSMGDPAPQPAPVTTRYDISTGRSCHCPARNQRSLLSVETAATPLTQQIILKRSASSARSTSVSSGKSPCRSPRCASPPPTTTPRKPAPPQPADGDLWRWLLRS